MKCPVCPDVNLVMTDRQGVEIDYCPQCRGVWLDRGELDKIIERSAASFSSKASGREAAPDEHADRRYPERRREHDDEYPYRKKRKGFLGELFDFD